MNPSTRILLALALSSLFGIPLTAAEKAKAESKSSTAPAKAASTAPTTPDTSTATPAIPVTATVGTQLSTSSAASSSAKTESIASSPTVTPATTIAPVSPALTSTSAPSKSSTPTTPTIDPITSRSTVASILSLAYTVTPSTVFKGLLTSASYEEQLRQIALRGELATTDTVILNAIFSGASEEFVNKAKERRKDYLPKRVNEIFALGHSKDLACNVDTITKLEEEIIAHRSDCEQALQAIESVKKSMADKLQKTKDQLMKNKQ